MRQVQVKSRETCIFYFVSFYLYFSSARLPPGNASIFCDGAREGYTSVFYTYVYVYTGAVAVGKVPSGAGGTRRVYMVVGGWAVKRDKKKKKKDG